MNIAEFLLPGMPELPEVETIVRQLQRAVVGKKIISAKVLLPKIVKAKPGKFQIVVKGATIKRIWRRAKILIWELDNGWSLLIHLKLTGQMIYQKTINNKQLTIKDKHTRVIFNFSDGSRLLFNDLRQFGYIKLIKKEGLMNFFIKERIGPEPLDKDFSLADLEVLLSRRPKTKIKQFLMDQKNLAGIGNIYADEILFASRVHPLRQVKSLSVQKIKNIFREIKNILTLAIKLRGTSSSDYLDAFGRKGGFLKKLKVYGREGQKCVKCKGGIKRIKIGGRSAHFCPKCQSR